MEEIRQYNDFYTRLRDRIYHSASPSDAHPGIRDYLLAIPDMFHLLVKLLFSDSVTTGDKLLLSAGVAYFIVPFDLLPEAFIGPLGFLDDLVVAALILNPMLKKYSREIEVYWAGNRDVYDLIAHILEKADHWLGSKLFSRLRRKFK